MRCPLLALWGGHSFVGRTYDVLDVWSRYATDVTGHALPCDHYLAEESPAQTTKDLLAFLTGGNEARICIQSG